MSDDREFSVDAARAAADDGDLAGWVTRFLASPGSDNEPLAYKLSEPARNWLGPVRLPLDQLHRLAGPAGEPVLCPVDEDFWRDDVEEMAARIEQDWEPPPVIVSYLDDEFVLEDGNHRVEGLRRAGKDRAWAVIGFESQADRDAFVRRQRQDAPDLLTP